MKNYKVYLIRNKEKKVVYVGFTTRTIYQRFLEHVSKKKVSHEEHKVELVTEWLTLDEAVTLEAMLIAQYDTIANGLNISPKHNTHSEATLKKTRVARSGKTNTTEHNSKIGDSNSKQIICLNNGKVYKSAREAAKDLCLQYSKISLVLNGKRNHTKGYRFKFLPINSL